MNENPNPNPNPKQNENPMPFTKANPMQAKLKVSMYGPPGSGKTCSALLAAEGIAAADGKRIAFVDTERGTDFYAKFVRARSFHPTPFDFDAIYTQSLATVIEECQALDPEVHGVIIIDSISHLWDAAIAAYQGKKVGKDEDKIPMNAWSGIKKPYKDFIRWLIDSPFHVFILGRQKNVFETTPSGEMNKVGVSLRAEGETAYEPHICVRMEPRLTGTNQEISTCYMIVEKDRSSVLSGRTIPMPDFRTWEPIMALLGAEQAQSEDPDEVVARDGELLDKQKAAVKEKAERSAGEMKGFIADIQAATTLEELGAIATAVRKRKRYLLEDHLNATRSLYEVRHKALSQQAAPAEVS